MAKIIGGVGISHIPALVPVQDHGDETVGEHAPFFKGCIPVRDWLAEQKPDIAVVVYNDHGLSFFLDAMPTFAMGAAPSYECGDEGWGKRPLPPLPGAQDLSWHLIESLVGADFDLTICQELELDHGASMPMRSLWKPDPDWDIRILPVVVNVIQHPLPSPRRCYDLGRALGAAIESFPGDEKIVVLGTGGMSHQLQGERAGFVNPEFDGWLMDTLVNDPERLAALTIDDFIRGAGTEGAEMIMWLVMRGALGPACRELHRNYVVPISVTAAGIQLIERAGSV